MLEYLSGGIIWSLRQDPVHTVKLGLEFLTQPSWFQKCNHAHLA